MTSYTSTHAWDVGYYYAVRGILHPPRGTWIMRFVADWTAGYKQAIADGKWASA